MRHKTRNLRGIIAVVSIIASFTACSQPEVQSMTFESVPVTTPIVIEETEATTDIAETTEIVEKESKPVRIVNNPTSEDYETLYYEKYDVFKTIAEELNIRVSAIYTDTIILWVDKPTAKLIYDKAQAEDFDGLVIERMPAVGCETMFNISPKRFGNLYRCDKETGTTEDYIRDATINDKLKLIANYLTDNRFMLSEADCDLDRNIKLQVFYVSEDIMTEEELLSALKTEYPDVAFSNIRYSSGAFADILWADASDAYSYKCKYTPEDGIKTTREVKSDA